MNHCFLPADILLPANASLERWSVIACDQFTSDIDYWKRVRKTAGSELSAVNMILPEAELSQSSDETINAINRSMEKALEENAFTCYPNAYVYVERTLKDGSVRQGIVGAVDLEAYDFHPEADAKIKATEQTVTERIPPRAAIRRNAPMEFSHTILFCDDPEKKLVEQVGEHKDTLQKLYDFDLMEGGGHIRGWLLTGNAQDAFQEALDAYMVSRQGQAAFLVADGNHSLATAKRCYEDLKKTLPEEVWKNHPARYAMVEVENIHSDVVVFHPIHRIITGIEPATLLSAMETASGEAQYPVRWVTAQGEGTVILPGKADQLQIAAVQPFLDAWLQTNPGQIDYIHDDDALRKLANAPACLGLLMETMDKSALFSFIASGHVLPRKTFSLGHAAEKRYYLEGRKIR